MKLAIVAAALAALIVPAIAQEGEGTPLLRVYIDTPYFYDLIATDIDNADPGANLFELYVEGKEVGASLITYDCVRGEYLEQVTQEWTGNAPSYVPAAMMAYSDLYC
ncbi:hypothetical protein [Devosia sp. 2618]|uniref:hypothetical protein n=1 Tax=Devosia sp. 2618 TaxID=3156454 RepID=UPI00339A94D5